jgi:transposase InsO family protein
MSQIINIPNAVPMRYGAPVLPIGQRVMFSGAEWRLIRSSSTTLQQVFERVHDRHVETLVYSQYADLWESSNFRILAPSKSMTACKMRVMDIPLEAFSLSTQRTINRKYHYVKAMDDALMDGTLRCKSRHDVEEWILKLDLPFGWKTHPSRGQVLRDYNFWIDSGKRKSVLAHGNAGIARDSVLGNAITDIIYDVLETYLAPNANFSIANAQSEITAEIMRRVEDGELPAEAPIPSESTIRDYKKKLSKYKVTRLQEGTYVADRQFEPRGTLALAQYPFQRWEIDHTLLPIPISVECSDTNGNKHKITVGRIWATIVIDVYSRMVLAIVLGLDPPSSARTIAALRMAMSPKGWLFDKYPDIENRIDLCVIPQAAVMDNGKDLHSEDVTALLCDFSITQIFAAAFRGDHKPYIERFNRSLKAFLLKTPGAIPKGARKKGPKRRDVKEPDPIELEDAERIIWKWLCDTYHVRPHAGLLGDKPASVMMRGIERVMAEKKNGKPVPFRSIMEYTPLELDAMFSLRLNRPVDHRGVRYLYLFWNGGQLARLIEETGCKRVEVRLNPSNLGRILVLHPTQGRWLIIDSTVPFYSNGLSLWLHRRILSRVLEREKAQADGKSPRARSIDLKKWLKNEGELLNELLMLTGKSRRPTRELRGPVQHLGQKLDWAVCVSRMDAIDIHNGKMPPGLSPLIDLVKNADGSYSAETKKFRRPEKAPESEEEPDEAAREYSYPTPEAIVDSDDSDMNANPIEQFDPNQVQNNDTDAATG